VDNEKMLNDEIMNSYVELLISKSTEKKFDFFHSGSQSLLISERRRQRFRDAHHIICPSHLPGHWIMAIADGIFSKIQHSIICNIAEKRLLTVTDSYQGYSTQQDKEEKITNILFVSFLIHFHI
jgi:Ulp1 family protease